MFLLDFSSRSHFGFCNGHGNSRTAWHVTRWSHEEVSVKMATTSDGDLSDFSKSSEHVNSPVNSLWLSQNSQTILMIFGSLLTKVKPRKIESERRSASKTSNLRISLFTSIKDRHCIQTTRILVNRPAINANDPMPPFRRIWCELRSVTARTQQICLNPHHRQCWTNAVNQQTQNICITFVQRWPNVSDVGPALYKCYRSTNVFCLLGIWSLVVFIHWIIYKIILKIMEFNPNGALIDFYQARVWIIVNKHINFVFQRRLASLTNFLVTTLGRSVCRPDHHYFWIIFVPRGAEFSWTVLFKKLSFI